MSSVNDYDVVIAGGGMVGASLALMLSSYSGGKIKVLVVETFPMPAEKTGTGSSPSAIPRYSPSFDARSTALSYGSRLILEALDLWPTLQQHLADIQSIHVSDQGHFGSTTMNRRHVDWPALGYVVENAWLGNVLLAKLRNAPGVTICAPAAVKRITPRRVGVELSIDADGASQTLTAQLAVVADGANSSLREQLGIDVSVNDYRQTAVIANVSFSRPHQGCAYERFTNQGPMALLPLTDSEQREPRSALVWSLPKDRALYLCDCNETEFLQQLQQDFGHRLGELNRVGERFSYPLKLVEAREQVRRGIAIMGNAAHSLHPVAGQGFNLALRDCARLTALVIAAHKGKKPLGELALLDRYASQQAFDQQKTIRASDHLPELFSHRQLPISILRGIGLTVLDSISAAKSQFIHHGAGLHTGAAIGKPV